MSTTFLVALLPAHLTLPPASADDRLKNETAYGELKDGR